MFRRKVRDTRPDAPHCRECGAKTIPLVGLVTPTLDYRLPEPTGYCNACRVITTDIPTKTRAPASAPDAQPVGGGTGALTKPPGFQLGGETP